MDVKEKCNYSSQKFNQKWKCSSKKRRKKRKEINRVTCISKNHVNKTNTDRSKQIIKNVTLTKSMCCQEKMVRKRQTETEQKETRAGRKGWGVKASRTHRGRGAIGPGSTPPSFVLTPAALPPVRVVPLTLSLAAVSVVIHVRGEISRIIVFGCSVRLPVPVPLTALVQSSVSLIVSSVERPVFCWAIVIAAAAQRHTDKMLCSKNRRKKKQKLLLWNTRFTNKRCCSLFAITNLSNTFQITILFDFKISSGTNMRLFYFLHKQIKSLRFNMVDSCKFFFTLKKACHN